MLMGLYLCITHMYTNIERYLLFKSQERPSINKNHQITFPKGKNAEKFQTIDIDSGLKSIFSILLISFSWTTSVYGITAVILVFLLKYFLQWNKSVLVTICLNSMHSKERLADYPSGFDYADTETLLEYYYVGGENIKRNLPIFDVLDTYGKFRLNGL